MKLVKKTAVVLCLGFLMFSFNIMIPNPWLTFPTMMKVKAEDTVILDIATGDITIFDTGYKLGNTTYQYSGEYIITGEYKSSGHSITIKIAKDVNLTFNCVDFEDNVGNKPLLDITESNVIIELNGTNKLYGNQDMSAYPIVKMDTASTLTIQDQVEDNGELIVQGSSNYWGGGDAISGGKLIVRGGTLTLVGGNKVVNNYGNCFTGEEFIVQGGTVNLKSGNIIQNEGMSETGNVTAKKVDIQGGVVYGGIDLYEEFYTVTIPERVEIGSSAEIKVDSISGIKENRKTLKVLLSWKNEEDKFPTLICGNEKINYTICKDSPQGTPIARNESVLSTNIASSVNLFFNKPDNIRYAGTYEGSVTFNIEVSD